MVGDKRINEGSSKRKGGGKKKQKMGRGKEEMRASVLGLNLIIVFIDYFLR